MYLVNGGGPEPAGFASGAVCSVRRAFTPGAHVSHYRARAVAVHATSADIGNVHVHVLGHVAAPSAESSGVSSGGVDDAGGDASLGFGSMAAVILAGLDAAASACTGGKQHDVVTCDFRGLKVKNIPLNPPPLGVVLHAEWKFPIRRLCVGKKTTFDN